jgi:hypothetical protein
MNNLQKVIFSSLDNLLNTNQQLFDYWYSELFDESDEPILEMWNEQNLYQMEKDVMHQLQD